MNDRKRTRLKAIGVLLKELRDEEKQDLKDTPDNIEYSAASDVFRSNVISIQAAILSLEEIE